MEHDPPCQLTALDMSVLEGMMDRLEAQAQTDTAVARLLRRKLAAVRVRLSDDIDPRVATINSRVAFRVGRGNVETRVLTHGGENALRGSALPISSLHGLALLGLAEGDTIALELADGSTEVLALVRVAHQPEAARVKRKPARFGVISGTRDRHTRASGILKKPDDDNDDDPGPRAA
jgi:regulator of nucleoside diphosphate kinase